MHYWEELLEEFRALGGVAENIRLGQGALGRGIFPVDPSKPVTVRVPENLLINSKDIVFENGSFRVRPGADVGDRERSWLERYQAELSWGAGGETEVAQIFEAARALPDELRRELRERFDCGSWFGDMTDAAVQEQFLAARDIDYHGRDVLMPVVELINHGNGPSVGLANGATVQGIFPGEVLIQYSNADSFGFFRSWGFVVERPVAFSLEMTGRIDSSNLHIERTFPSVKAGQRSGEPNLRIDADGASLPYLLIGNVAQPRLPKAVFYKIMRGGGFSAVEEPFDVIRHVNTVHFLDLLKVLDGIDLPMAHSLRTMTHFQLRAIASCYGQRLA